MWSYPLRWRRVSCEFSAARCPWNCMVQKRHTKGITLGFRIPVQRLQRNHCKGYFDRHYQAICSKLSIVYPNNIGNTGSTKVSIVYQSNLDMYKIFSCLSKQKSYYFPAKFAVQHRGHPCHLSATEAIHKLVLGWRITCCSCIINLTTELQHPC